LRVDAITEGEQALALWSGLLERGVYVNLIFPPATPNAAYLLRASVSAAHSDAQIDKICDTFAEVQETIAASSPA
jgi:8-amino-7-oxononanoate synthase